MAFDSCERDLGRYVKLLRELDSYLKDRKWDTAWQTLQLSKAVLTCAKCREDEASEPPHVLSALEEVEVYWDEWHHPCHCKLPGLLRQRVSPPQAPMQLPIVKVCFTHDWHSSEFRHGAHAGQSVEWLASKLFDGTAFPSEPSMVLNVVRIHGRYYSLNNRHAAALVRFAHRLEKNGQVPPECWVRVWPLVRGLRLDDGSNSEVVHKFRSAYSTQTHGRDAIMRPKVSGESSGGRSSQHYYSTIQAAETVAAPVRGWVRCKQCHSPCAPLCEAHLLMNVHQPENDTMQERLRQPRSLFCVTTKEALQNCHILPHRGQDEMPYKLGAVQCEDCGSKVANVQDVSVMEGDWTKELGAEAVCLKCSELVLELPDCDDRYVQSLRWVSYYFALNNKRKACLASISMKQVLARRQTERNLQFHLQIVPARGARKIGIAALDPLPDVPRLAVGIRQHRMSALGRRLGEQLENDLRVCAQFLEMRDCALQHAKQSEYFDAYEFNNIYARFYLSARVALGEACDGNGVEQTCDQEFASAYGKMQSELASKRMPPLPDGCNPFQDFVRGCSAFPGVCVVLQGLQEDNDGDTIVYTYRSAESRVSMKCPGQVVRRLRECARQFLSEHCHEVREDTAEIILRTTVLNHIVSCSGLLWGLGPKFYQRAEEVAAVLECYASPFNSCLPVYCSPCAPLDLIFGSVGSFHQRSVDELLQRASPGSLIVAAPPYIESELLACTKRIADLVKRWPIRSACIYPEWSDASGVREAMKACARARGKCVKLPQREHVYFDYENWQSIVARFASLGFIFAHESQPDAEERLVEMFDLLRCEDDGARRGKGRRTFRGGTGGSNRLGGGSKGSKTSTGVIGCGLGSPRPLS